MVKRDAYSRQNINDAIHGAADDLPPPPHMPKVEERRGWSRRKQLLSGMRGSASRRVEVKPGAH